MISFIPDIGQYVIQFLISVGFAFLIGMEIYAKTPDENKRYLFGSERTFAFIALLGFVLLKSGKLIPGIYLTGFAVFAVFLMIYYYRKLSITENRGLTTITLGLLVFVLPLVIEQFPIWFSLLVITIIMVLLEAKNKLKEFSKKIYTDDFMTLAKFVFLSGVILPLVPDKEIIPGIPVSPYKLWLAIVVISAISYLSYLLRKYVFTKAGLILTAILGGLYSSTATTFIIAKKSKEGSDAPSHYAAAILAATALMFFRVFILIAIFNRPLSVQMLPWFVILFGVSAGVSFLIYRIAPARENPIPAAEINRPNPLELRVALIFGVLYVAFSLLTQYMMQYYGHSGLTVLSFIVGFTDIDPFLLNMFQGKYAGITSQVICLATLQAVASNNILKMVYALLLGDKATRKYVAAGFATIIAVNILLLFFI